VVTGRTALVAILVAAGLARFWAIDFCLPARICRPDEEAVASIATLFFARDFNPHFFDWPALFMYAVAAGVVVFFKIGLWLEWFRGEWHFLQTISADPAPVFLIARVLSATAGIVSVWLLFRIGVRLFSQRTALVAAAFLALAFLHVRDSHFGVTDVTATCFALAGLLYLIRFDRSHITRDLVVAAIWSGLAMSTKYGAAMVAAPALWVALWPGSSSQRSWSARLRHAVLFLTVMAIAFAVTSPYCLIAFDQFINAIRGVSAHLATPHAVMLGRGWQIHLTSSLRYGLGLPLLAAGLAGCVLLVRRSVRDAAIVLLFPLVYYATVGTGYTAFARYAVPLVPFLCLTAALTVTEAARAIASATGRAAREPLMVWLLAAIVIAPSLWATVQFDRLLARQDSRILAAAWVTAHVPEGALIEETGSPWTHLFLPANRHRQFAFKEGDQPDVLVVPASPRLPVDEAAAAARGLTERYRKVCEIEAFDPSAGGILYDWQDEFYLPLAGFDSVRLPGPNLTIYARPDLANAQSWSAVQDCLGR
jgi:Dolichyl-phosphate-mannose-protein mannosyltransferase